MKLYYDLHIHSALSPCGDNDMTPNNIVNMARLKGLNIIAVTDHNSCGNVGAVIQAAGDDLLILPGMEIETSEEVHVLCYFPTLPKANDMWNIIKKNMNSLKNRPEIFGNQYYMNSNDEIVGEEENLLVSATNLTIYDVINHAKECGGVAVPAHIDRASYSVLANLGFIPPDLSVKTVEITNANVEKLKPKYSQYGIITNSDAHYLGDISEANHFLDIVSKNPCEILYKITNSVL
ncbi:MAG: PHP domain-containing protein [Oscillospiraceae bacterium]